MKFPFLAVMLVPGQQRLTVFLCSPFLGPPPTSSLSGVVAGTGIELGTGYPEIVDHEVDGAFVGRPPAVTPNAVSGWGQFRLEFPRLRITRWMVLLLGAPPRCDPNCGQRVGAKSSGASENEDHEMDGAFAGRLPRCDPTCGQRAGAKLDESELQDAQVQASGGENVGVFHVHNLLGNINRSRRASGWKTSPTLRGGSGAVLPAQRTQRNRCVRGRRTTLPRPCDVAPLEGASGSVRLEAGSDSFALLPWVWGCSPAKTFLRFCEGCNSQFWVLPGCGVCSVAREVGVCWTDLATQSENFSKPGMLWKQGASPSPLRTPVRTAGGSEVLHA